MPSRRARFSSALPLETPAALNPESTDHCRDTRSDALAGAGPLAGLERPLGLAHFAQAAGHHALNWIVTIIKRIFQRLTISMALRLARNPQGNASVRLLQILNHQLAAARTVKGENQYAEWAEQPQSPRAT